MWRARFVAHDQENVVVDLVLCVLAHFWRLMQAPWYYASCNSWHCCLCCWCNDIIAIMNHHVNRRNDGNTERTANLLISPIVHYTHLGGDNNNKSGQKAT